MIKFTDYLSYYIYQRIAHIIFIVIKNSDISPNQVTIGALIFGCSASLFLISGNKVMALILLQLSFVLDCLDGQIARAKQKSSEFGMWLDNVVDRVVEGSFILALSYFYDFSTIGVLLMFLSMLYSYMSDLDIYLKYQVNGLLLVEKILFLPIYFLNRSFVILILSLAIFDNLFYLLLIGLYAIGIIFLIYRKVKNVFISTNS